MKTRFELNVDLEALNEKKLFQEEYDNEMYNYEREYFCSKEYGREYKYMVDYWGTRGSPYALDGSLTYCDFYDFVFEEQESIQQILELEIQEEYWLTKLDQLHSMKYDDPDEEFVCYSYLSGHYDSNNNSYANKGSYFTIYPHNWTIQDLKDYLYNERKTDEERTNQLRYERLEDLLS